MNKMPLGDRPIKPLTDESLPDEDYQYPLQTMQSAAFSNKKYMMVETMQSHQSLQKRLNPNPTQITRQSQQLYQDFLKKGIKKTDNLILEEKNIFQKLSEESVANSKKRQQLQERGLKQELQECSFKPVISEKSKQLGEYFGTSPRYMSPRANKENIFARLYGQKKSIPEAEPKEHTRVGSPKHVVDQIVNRLYENAFQKKRIKSPRAVVDNILPDENRIKYQIQHFVKEFYKAITDARLWTLENWDEEKKKIQLAFQHETDLCLLTINELAYILDKLHFLPFGTYDLNNCPIIQIFQILQCPTHLELILSRNLLTFLFAMQGIHINQQLVPKYVNIYEIKFPKRFESDFIFEEGNIMISNVSQVQKQFQHLYNNYLSYRRPEQPQVQEPEQFRTTQATQVMANNYRNRVHSQFNMSDYNEIYNKKRQSLASEVDSHRLKECTFKPQTNSNRAEPKYHITQRNQPAKELEDLPSFTPDISRSQSTHQLKGSPVNQTNIVQRLVKGRIEKQLNQLIIGSGTCNQKKRKILEHQLYKDEITKIKERQPLLYVDVSLCNSTCKRITIHKGDEPEVLAERFIIDNRLAQSVKPQLVQLIQEQLNTLTS